MDSDNMSIASDFSIIPEMGPNDLVEQDEAPMCTSIFRSAHSDSSLGSKFVDKVIFKSVQRIATDQQAPLSVIFYFAEDFSPKASDRIALYKVGFSSSKDFLCFKWAPAQAQTVDSQSFPQTVMFEAELFHNLDDEFYQICYLMKNGQIAGVSTPFNANAAEKSESITEVENAARNVLSIRIQELVKENTGLKEELSQFKDQLCTYERANDELIQERAAHIGEKDVSQKWTDQLKGELSVALDEIEKLKMDILEKDKAIEAEKALSKDCETKLTSTVLQMMEMNRKLTDNEEEISITEERQNVLAQDNQDMKASLAAMKEELVLTMQEKVVSETIASDLSQELQSTRAMNDELTTINWKLTKKVKKLRRFIDILENSNEEWHYVLEDRKSLNAEEEDEDGEEKRVADVDSETELASASVSGLVRDGTAIGVSDSLCSSSMSSQVLGETVYSLKKKMEEIVSQLVRQTGEMKLLKEEMARKNQHQQQQSTSMECSAIALEPPCSETLRDCNKNLSLPSSEEEKKILYSKSFLPANCTAPVFFPSHEGTTNAGATNLSNSRRSTATETSVAACSPAPQTPTHSLLNEEGMSLPAPLCPETTTTARKAAVMRQFSDSISSSSVTTICDSVENQAQCQQPPQEQQQQFLPPVQQQSLSSQELQQLHQQEPSQEISHLRTLLHQRLPESQQPQQFQNHQQGPGGEDHLSTGDSGAERRLKCPLCPLEFWPNALKLLEEHCNNHLDRTCPMCSAVFQRSYPPKKFEEHVNSHFSDNASEENVDLDAWDTSSNSPSAPRRNPFYLLEFD